MKRTAMVTFCAVFFFVQLAHSETFMKKHAAPAGLLLTGIGIGTIWTMDLISQKNVDMNGNIFGARDKSTGQVMWPHLLAEYGTAATAIIGAVGLYRDDPWAESLTLVSSGMLAYTSVNSMSWVLSQKGRLVYAVPMMIGLASAGIGIIAAF